MWGGESRREMNLVKGMWSRWGVMLEWCCVWCVVDMFVVVEGGIENVNEYKDFVG